MAYVCKKNYDIYNDLPVELGKYDYVSCHDLAAEVVVLMLKKGYEVTNVKMCGLYTDIFYGKFQSPPSEDTCITIRKMENNIYEAWLPVSPPNHIEFEFSQPYDIEDEIDHFNENCLEYNIGCEAHIVDDKLHLFVYCHDMPMNSHQRLFYILRMMDFLYEYIEKWENV